MAQKKIPFLIIPALLLFFFFILPCFLKRTYAYCLPTAIKDLTNCNENYDCENNVGSTTGNNPAFCNAIYSGSCYEVVEAGRGDFITFCFAPKDSPTPIPQECGTLGYICCPPPDLCKNGLIPQSTDIGNCFCVNPDEPLPTRVPAPTGSLEFDPWLQDMNYLCKEDKDCLNCLYDNKSWTALGCIPTDPMALIKWIFPYLLGFGGLAAFALIVFSGIQILTSAGNPEKIQGAKETITSAITGLLFIILSLFLLEMIGVDILRIPGL